MSEQQDHAITRKVRIWPEMPGEVIHLPHPPDVLSTKNPFILIAVVCSLVGSNIYILLLPIINSFSLSGLLTLSIIILLSGILNFLFHWLPTRRRKKRLKIAYMQKLVEVRRQLQACSQRERQARIELDPPFMLPDADATPGLALHNIVPITKRSLNNQDMHLWARRPDDPDFLSLRVGMGYQPSSFPIQQSLDLFSSSPTHGFTQLFKVAQSLSETYSSLLVPIKVKLDKQSTTAFLATDGRLGQSRQLACVMVAYLAYHHSPEDVRIIVLAPESRKADWEWATLLPHTMIYDPKQAGDETSESGGLHAVAIGNEAVVQQLPIISRELGRRELLQGDSSHKPSGQPELLLPRLVIVVDYFDAIDDLDQPTMFLTAAIMPFKKQKQRQQNDSFHRPRLTISPLRRPEMTLALNYGTALGVSVLAICGKRTDIPPSTSLLIDLDSPPVPGLSSQQPATQARIRLLQPAAPPAVACDWLDEAPLNALQQFAQQMFPLRPVTTRRLEIRTQVDMCMLFDPYLDLASYDPHVYWNDAAWRSSDGTPLMRIPIGLKIGDELQYLDFIKDGPHGLLIGQTGSGKSELLQTIITTLAVVYPPTEVNFLLVDYKAGLVLEPFSQLPHTIGFLSNVSSPTLIQRFIAILRDETTRRELRLKEGTSLPHLVIIIDDFVEMVRRASEVLEDLFTITRLGREIGMHLLLSAQRPEDIISSKIRDWVQYRLCLRCASPKDSREVLRRVDAATLPASIPGRGYLLHGDNQLDLFQAARVSIPAPSSSHMQSGLLGRDIHTVSTVILPLASKKVRSESKL